MGIVYFVLGFLFALVLVHFYPGIGTVIGAAWNWLKGKFGSKAGE